MENFAIVIRGVPGIPSTEAANLMTQEFVSQGYVRLETPEFDLGNQPQGHGVVLVVDYESRIAIEMTQNNRTRDQARVHAYIHSRLSVIRFVEARVPEGLRKVVILNGFDHEFDGAWDRQEFYPYFPMPTTAVNYTDYLCWSLVNFQDEAIADLPLEERARLYAEAGGQWFGVDLRELSVRDIEAHARSFEGYVRDHPLVDQVRMFVYLTFLM